VIIEDKLCKWLLAGLAIYKAHPLMIESIFWDSSHSGSPTALSDGLLVDTQKLWLPDEYAGGMLRWGSDTFSIISNTGTTLAVSGDPSLTTPEDPFCYQIVPPAVSGLTQFLETEKFSVSSTFAQVPTNFPAVTVRLEKDEQADTYIGENLEHYAVDGVEFDIRSQALTGNYLLSIWTQNREACLWMYSWLQNYALNSIPMFNTWGLYDVSFSGSDLDPTLQYLAERVYTRHLLFTCSRIERAVSTREVEWVSSFCVKVCAQYAQFRLTVPAME
jgi:hypothetical protein